MFKLRKYAISGSFTRTYTRLGTVIHFPPQLLTIRGGAYLLNGVFEGGQLDVTVVKELLQLPNTGEGVLSQLGCHGYADSATAFVTPPSSCLVAESSRVLLLQVELLSDIESK